MAFKLEGKIDKAMLKIKDVPHKALLEAGKVLTAVVRNAAPKSTRKRKVSRVRRTKGIFGTRKNKYYKEILPGRIKKSIRYKQDKETGDIIIGSAVFYARMVEFGTSKMTARPFLKNTIAANIHVVEKLVKEALKNI